MSDLPDISPRADRVIAQLQRQLGEALGQVAMLEDLVTQLQAERAASAAPTAPPAGPSSAAVAAAGPAGTTPDAG